jgi:hypothetical protein
LGGIIKFGLWLIKVSFKKSKTRMKIKSLVSSIA